MQFETICVVGLGYIGLPTAAAFAGRRKNVIGVDINQHAVDTINRGEIHIVEPELDIAVHAAVKEGNLRATTRPEPADAFLVAVPTPFKKGEEAGAIPTPDLSYIQAAADSIAPVLKKGDLVILESTSPRRCHGKNGRVVSPGQNRPQLPATGWRRFRYSYRALSGAGPTRPCHA